MYQKKREKTEKGSGGRGLPDNIFLRVERFLDGGGGEKFLLRNFRVFEIFSGVEQFSRGVVEKLWGGGRGVEIFSRGVENFREEVRFFREGSRRFSVVLTLSLFSGIDLFGGWGSGRLIFSGGL